MFTEGLKDGQFQYIPLTLFLQIPIHGGQINSVQASFIQDTLKSPWSQGFAVLERQPPIHDY